MSTRYRKYTMDQTKHFRKELVWVLQNLAHTRRHLKYRRHFSCNWLGISSERENVGSSSMRSKDKGMINRYCVSRIKSLQLAVCESVRTYYLVLLCETRPVYFILTSSACQRAGAVQRQDRCITHHSR